MTDQKRKVYVVPLEDAGDNGWSIVAVCASPEAAGRWMDQNRQVERGSFYFGSVEEHEVVESASNG